MNLGGYSLSDDATQPKWFFPKASIRPHERVFVFASGRNKTYATHHWETAIFSDDLWKWKIPDTTMPANWQAIEFDDSGWNESMGGIGFGDGDDGTEIGYCTSVFMRKKFFVSDSAALTEAVLHADYDDAFVAYLNGVEFARSGIGLSGSETPFDAFPAFQHEATMYRGMLPESFVIDHAKLKQLIRQGENVLAVQTHNSYQSNDLSSNYYLSFGIADAQTFFRNSPSWSNFQPSFFHANFKLKTGEVLSLYNPSGNLIDSLLIRECSIDNSFGRTEDGSSSKCYFKQPTPNLPNDAWNCFSHYEQMPTVSLPAGFYDSTIVVDASAEPGATIRYAFGGKIPDENDSIYTSPILIDSTTVVAFRAFGTGSSQPSEALKLSYFINENHVTLPVVSISTNPENLWSDSIGIYTKGNNAGMLYPFFGANFWNKWERLSFIEFFDRQRQLLFAAPFGLKIHGNWSRGQGQKGLRVDFDHKYGVPRVDYPLIADKPNIFSYRAFNLRNAGNDFFGSRFRDALMQRSVKHTNVDYMAYTPVVVFLNGSYWGLYELREKMDQEYLHFNRGVNPSEVDLISYDHNLGFQVHNGSDSAFFETFFRITSVPNDAPHFYELLNEHIDVPNYADYFITEIFYANSDWMGEWTNNIKCWRERKSGSKWRYMLWDLDYGCGFVNPDGNVIMSKPQDVMWNRARRPIISNEHARLFNHIVGNIRFRNYLLNRMADLMNTTLSIDSFTLLAQSMKAEVAPEIPRHQARWGGSWQMFENSIDSMLLFVEQRPAFLFQNTVNEFGLNKTEKICVIAEPENAGAIQLNTLHLHQFPFSGTYFDGVPIELKAYAESGFEFSHWQSKRLFTNYVRSDSLTVNVSTTDTLIAVFELKKTATSENELKSILAAFQLSTFADKWLISSNENESLVVSLFDILGNKITTTVGTRAIALSKQNLSDGVYIIQAQSENQQKTWKVVVKQ